MRRTSNLSTRRCDSKAGRLQGSYSSRRRLRTVYGITLLSLLIGNPSQYRIILSTRYLLTLKNSDITVYYSEGFIPLRAVNETKNDNSGQGQQHFGIIKLPTGDADLDVVHEGFQESGIDEGLVYGGLFIEDSSDGCVTLF